MSARPCTVSRSALMTLPMSRIDVAPDAAIASRISASSSASPSAAGMNSRISPISNASWSARSTRPAARNCDSESLRCFSMRFSTATTSASAKLAALVDLDPFDLGTDQPQHRNPGLVPGLHRVLGGFSNPSAEIGHGPGGSETALEAPGFALQLFLMAFDRGRGLALADRRRLFVELAATYFGQNACFFAGSFETSQRDVERFVLSDFD